MATPDILHELKTLVRSMHPVVVVETSEEERLDQLLRALAADLRLPLFTWTVTRGLRRIDGTGMIHGTSDPRTLLRHLSTLTVADIFHLKDPGYSPADADAGRGRLRPCRARISIGSARPRGRFAPVA